MQGYKQSTVDSNTKGIEFLFKKNKVDWLKGWGKITAPGEVAVGDTTHKAKNIVIASGSEVTPLRGVTIDEKTIVSSTGALDLPEIPSASPSSAQASSASNSARSTPASAPR